MTLNSVELLLVARVILGETLVQPMTFLCGGMSANGLILLPS